MTRRAGLIFTVAIALIGREAASADQPYPASRSIHELQIDWQTHRREAPGSDNWPMTWSSDGNLYAAWGDGGGFGGTNGLGRVSLGVARIEGDWPNHHGVNLWGGHNAVAPATFGGKSYGLFSCDGMLLMWTSVDPLPHLAETRLAVAASAAQARVPSPHLPAPESRLANGSDSGQTWTLSQWSLKFEDGITVPTFLNFGQDGHGARDTFVYSYAIRPRYGPGPAKSANAYNGFDVHRPGEIDLLRVPKARVLDRSAYEFFAGTENDGQVRWTANISDKTPVFEDPNGVGWNMSATYNAGLKRYLICTEHSFSHKGCLGVFDAPEPWGPWTTVAYLDDFGEGHIPVNAFTWNFPAKWISPDGHDAVMVFSGVKENDALNTIRVRFVAP